MSASEFSLSVRDSFAATFGEGQALAIERAADEHDPGANYGTDPFKWAISIALGFECVSKDAYRDYHGITAPWEDIRAWIKSEADLGTHDGDVDVLSALVGVYSEFVS